MSQFGSTAFVFLNKPSSLKIYCTHFLRPKQLRLKWARVNRPVGREMFAVYNCGLYHYSLWEDWIKIRLGPVYSLTPGLVSIRVKVRNKVRVRISSGLQLAGSKLWAGPDFRHHHTQLYSPETGSKATMN